MDALETTARAKPRRRGHVAATVGCVLGVAVLGSAGAGAGLVYADSFMRDVELERILPFLVGLVIGVLLGACLGSWTALRVLRRAAAARTAAIVAALFPLVFIALSFARIAVGISLIASALVAPPLARALTPLPAEGTAGGIPRP